MAVMGYLQMTAGAAGTAARAGGPDERGTGGRTRASPATAEDGTVRVSGAAERRVSADDRTVA
jgi:hypothetical protein